MVKTETVIFGLILVIFIGIGLTVLAKWRGTSPLSFWIVPFGASIPWLLATILVLIASSFVEPKYGSEAAPMAAMFPLFGIFLSFFFGIIVSFLLGPETAFKQRFIWSVLTSGILALLVGGYLSIVLIFNL